MRPNSRPQEPGHALSALNRINYLTCVASTVHAVLVGNRLFLAMLLQMIIYNKLPVLAYTFTFNWP